MQASSTFLDFTKHPDSARRLKALLDEAIRQKKAQVVQADTDTQVGGKR